MNAKQEELRKELIKLSFEELQKIVDNVMEELYRERSFLGYDVLEKQ